MFAARPGVAPAVLSVAAVCVWGCVWCALSCCVCKDDGMNGHGRGVTSPAHGTCGFGWCTKAPVCLRAHTHHHDAPAWRIGARQMLNRPTNTHPSSTAPYTYNHVCGGAPHSTAVASSNAAVTRHTRRAAMAAALDLQAHSCVVVLGVCVIDTSTSFTSSAQPRSSERVDGLISSLWAATLAWGASCADGAVWGGCWRWRWRGAG
jgi:hypothetical protein